MLSGVRERDAMSVIASIVPPSAMEPNPIPEPPEPRLVVAKAVRDFLKGLPAPVKCGAEAISALDAKLRTVLLEAVSRAEGNGRKTLKPIDL